MDFTTPSPAARARASPAPARQGCPGIRGNYCELSPDLPASRPIPSPLLPTASPRSKKNVPATRLAGTFFAALLAIKFTGGRRPRPSPLASFFLSCYFAARPRLSSLAAPRIPARPLARLPGRCAAAARPARFGLPGLACVAPRIAARPPARLLASLARCASSPVARALRLAGPFAARSLRCSRFLFPRLRFAIASV